MTYIPIKDGAVSTNSSSTATLGAAGVFSGTADDTKGYSTVNVFAVADVSGTLLIQESADNSNFDKQTRVNFEPTRQDYIDTTVVISARYVKIIYTNGDAIQSNFRLATTYHGNKSATDTPQKIKFSSGSRDGFDRVITCSPVTNVDVHRVLGLNDLQIINYAAGTGATITHNTNESSAALTLASGATNGSTCTSRSRARIVYQPSKVIDTIMTGMFEAYGDAGVIARMGLFDDNSGIFIGRQSTGDVIGHRTRVSGSVVETLVARADWNGPSQNFTLDTTKTNIYNFRHAWLGVSSIQVAVLAHGNRHILHTFFFENVQTTVFQLTGCLPLSWTIENTGANTTAASTLTAICGSISSLAGATPSGKSFSVSNGNTSVAVNGGVETALLSLAIDATSYAYECVQAIMTNISVICTSNANVIIRARLFQDVALTSALSGAVWTSVGSESGVQVGIGGTLVTTGSREVSSSYFTASIDSINLPIDDSARITYNSKNAMSDILVITAQRSSGTQNEVLYASLDFTSYI